MLHINVWTFVSGWRWWTGIKDGPLSSPAVLRVVSICERKSWWKKNIYKNIEEFNLNKKGIILIVFHDIIADMLSNKKLNPIVMKLFIRGRKLNISCFYHTISFRYSKNIRLTSTHYFVMKILSKWGLLQITFNHSSNIDF